MKLVITGGGTGGHVYPALEVALTAAKEGWTTRYLGSIRGQEGPACEKLGIAFKGFPSEPVYSIKTPKGWRAMLRLLRATQLVKSEMRNDRPDAVFATGGYSSAPILSAARSLKIPYVIHEQNSVPGRSNLMFGKKAFCIATSFFATEAHFKGCRVLRTGLPVRESIRELADKPTPLEQGTILVVGGSQGAAAINQSALETAERMTSAKWKWMHITGKSHFDDVFHSYKAFGLSSCYEVKAFLEGDEMGKAYAQSSLAFCRSGAGTLSELAVFGIPSILVPYPFAFANHQHHNAVEFRDMGASLLISQPDLHSSKLEEAIHYWMNDPTTVEVARKALKKWDCPNAASDIVKLVSEATSN